MHDATANGVLARAPGHRCRSEGGGCLTRYRVVILTDNFLYFVSETGALTSGMGEAKIYHAKAEAEKEADGRRAHRQKHGGRDTVAVVVV
jgi:hypothetical protein